MSRQQTTLLSVLAVGAVVVYGSLGTGGASSPAAHPAPTAPALVASPPRAVDHATLYNSVAVVFLQRYRKVKGYKVKLTNSGGTYCDEKDGVYDCEPEVDFGFGASELWGYRVQADATTGCWTGRTYHQYGGHQEDVDSYRNRDWLAPSRSKVRKMVREAKRLRRLKGCIDQAKTPSPSEGTTAFMAGFASQNVKREFPGRQRKTSCSDLGKDVIALAPDSYEFRCQTKMASGKKYVDEISCFDPPPYDSYKSCTEHDDNPRIPLRPVP